MRVTVIDVDLLSRNWWVVLLRGLAGIFFGIFTLIAPRISLAALVLVFGAYAFADGVLAIATAFRARGTTERWWVLLLEGLVGVAAGLVTIVWPGTTALVLLFVIAVWAILTGAFEIAAAIKLRNVIKGEWLLAVSGYASVAFGALLMFFPGTGALAVVLWIGAYAIVFGVLLVALAFRLRSWGRSGALRTAPGVA
jgi:uncharacterized membrane protein HdeD (DUF308 family)